MRIYLIIAFLLLMNAFFIISENDLKLVDSNNSKIFFNLYINWFANIGNNLETITGNVVNLNWIPDNSKG